MTPGLAPFLPGPCSHSSSPPPFPSGWEAEVTPSLLPQTDFNEVAKLAAPRRAALGADPGSGAASFWTRLSPSHGSSSQRRRACRGEAAPGNPSYVSVAFVPVRTSRPGCCSRCSGGQRVSSCVCVQAHTRVAVFSFSPAPGQTLRLGRLSLHRNPARERLGFAPFCRPWGGITDSGRPD